MHPALIPCQPARRQPRAGARAGHGARPYPGAVRISGRGACRPVPAPVLLLGTQELAERRAYARAKPG